MSRTFVRHRWPLLLAACSLIAVFAVQVAAVSRATHGQQWFILDDPYIQASIARNLLRYHSYGVAPHVFAAASSSIVWPFLLALIFAIFGVHAGLILALNFVLSLAALWLADTVWRAFAPPGYALIEALVLVLIVVAGSLVSLVFVGLEHILQYIAVLALLAVAARILAAGRGSHFPTSQWQILEACGMLAVAVRFESGFAVCLICILLWISRHRRPALRLAVLSALPMVLFGVFSMAHGAYFFPNSVLLKGTYGHNLTTGILDLFGPYAMTSGLFAIWALLCLLLILSDRLLEEPHRRPAFYFALLIALLTPVHCQFAAVGWGFRYEAYLVAAAILAIGLLSADCLKAIGNQPLPSARYAVLAVLFLLATCSIPRIVQTQKLVVPATRSIYLQQWQTARFLARYYPSQTVVVNDIGSVSYLRPGPLVDLYALGTFAVTRLSLQGHFTTSSIDQLTSASGAPVAMVFDYSFQGTASLPPSWTKVATLELPLSATIIVLRDPRSPNGILTPFRAVSVYATSPDQGPPLLNHLQSFLPCLPPEVTLHLLAGPLAHHDFHGGGSCSPVNQATADSGIAAKGVSPN